MSHPDRGTGTGLGTDLAAAGALADLGGSEVEVPFGAKASASLGQLRRRFPAFLALTDQGVTSVATFVAGVLVARATSPGAFGIYTLVSVAAVWANGAHAALVTTPYTYRQGRCERQRRPAYTGSILLHHWLLCVFMALVMAPLVAVLVAWPAPAALVFPIVLVTVGVLVKEYLRATFYAHLQIGRALLVNLGIASMQLGGMTALWATGHLSIITALVAMGIPPLVVGSPVQVARARQSEFNFRDGLRELGASWSFSRWLLAGMVVNALSRDAYPWLLAALRGVEATGRYAAHLNIALLVNPAIIGVSNYIAPSFARTVQEKGPAALVQRVHSTAVAIGLAMLAYSLVLLVAGGAVSAAIYGDRLRASGLVVAVIALGLTVTAYSTPYGIALYALGRADITVRASVAAVVVSLLVGIPAMIKIGVPGAAIAYLLSALVEHAVKWYELRRLLPSAIVVADDV